ncbi:MAG: hypothetical protein IKQ80_10070 [Clostridia bacterium]|nr:hypothetical protein [Clostridia bacterium]
MMRKIGERKGGINRLIALLLALIAMMLVIIAVPAWQKFRYRSEKIACEQAMKSARDGLIIDYLAHSEAGTAEDAMKTLDEVLPERDDICPSGGTVYLLRGSNGIFEPFCGLHDTDTFRRARLNASHALDLLRESLRHARRESDAEPEAVEIKLNGKRLSCVRADSLPNMHRGTRYYHDYKGVVAFYTLEDAADGAGDIASFLYADEDHCATWSEDKAWGGEAYEG